MKLMFLFINIPLNYKIIFWNKKNIKLINIFYKTKKFVILNINNINLDKWTNSLFFKNNNNLKYNNIENFLKKLELYYYEKIKFKGKGFRIKFLKKNKLIKFYFGKSHITNIILKKIKRKKLNKYKFIIYSINKIKLKNLIFYINKIKKINLYTTRGLRLSRQIIYKRKGKKGTYI